MEDCEDGVMSEQTYCEDCKLGYRPDGVYCVTLCNKHKAVDDLIAALKVVEWVSPSFIFYCPWCSAHKYIHRDGKKDKDLVGIHADDCSRQAVIAKAESS